VDEFFLDILGKFIQNVCPDLGVLCIGDAEQNNGSIRLQTLNLQQPNQIAQGS
jgi:hypothetical protein